MSIVQRSRQVTKSALAPTAKLQVDYVRIDRLRPSLKNARLHSRKKVRQLAQSIAALRVISPIIVDENFEILAGHARLEAAKLLGLSEVPVIQVKHLSEAEKRAYRLADNRFSEKATWDSELLSIEVRELIDLEFDIELMGFDTADVDIILRGEGIGADDDLDIPVVSSGPPRRDVLARLPYPWPRTRQSHVLSRKQDASSPSQLCPVCITNMLGFVLR